MQSSLCWIYCYVHLANILNAQNIGSSVCAIQSMYCLQWFLNLLVVTRHFESVSTESSIACEKMRFCGLRYTHSMRRYKLLHSQFSSSDFPIFHELKIQEKEVFSTRSNDRLNASTMNSFLPWHRRFKSVPLGRIAHDLSSTWVLCGWEKRKRLLALRQLCNEKFHTRQSNVQETFPVCLFASLSVQLVQIIPHNIYHLNIWGAISFIASRWQKKTTFLFTFD